MASTRRTKRRSWTGRYTREADLGITVHSATGTQHHLCIQTGQSICWTTLARLAGSMERRSSRPRVGGGHIGWLSATRTPGGRARPRMPRSECSALLTLSPSFFLLLSTLCVLDSLSDNRIWPRAPQSVHVDRQTWQLASDLRRHANAGGARVVRRRNIVVQHLRGQWRVCAERVLQSDPAIPRCGRQAAERQVQLAVGDATTGHCLGCPRPAPFLFSSLLAMTCLFDGCPQLLHCSPEAAARGRRHPDPPLRQRRDAEGRVGVHCC